MSTSSRPRRIDTAVIAAAGSGSRFGNLRKPKGFLNIAGRPLIEYSLEALQSHGITTFIVGTGYQAHFYEGYRQFSLVTSHNADYRTTGSLQTLRRLSDRVTGDVLLLDSDVLYDPYCVGELIDCPRPDVVLLGREDHQRDCVYVETKGGRVVGMSKNRADLTSAEGVLVGLSKISYETWGQIMEFADTADGLTAHHDWAFMHTRNPFYPLVLDDLLFTEIDDDEQLAYAMNVVYPKLSLRV